MVAHHNIKQTKQWQVNVRYIRHGRVVVHSGHSATLQFVCFLHHHNFINAKKNETLRFANLCAT